MKRQPIFLLFALLKIGSSHLVVHATFHSQTTTPSADSSQRIFKAIGYVGKKITSEEFEFEIDPEKRKELTPLFRDLDYEHLIYFIKREIATHDALVETLEKTAEECCEKTEAKKKVLCDLFEIYSNNLYKREITERGREYLCEHKEKKMRSKSSSASQGEIKAQEHEGRIWRVFREIDKLFGEEDRKKFSKQLVSERYAIPAHYWFIFWGRVICEALLKRDKKAYQYWLEAYLNFIQSKGQLVQEYEKEYKKGGKKPLTQEDKDYIHNVSDVRLAIDYYNAYFGPYVRFLNSSLPQPIQAEEKEFEIEPLEGNGTAIRVDVSPERSQGKLSYLELMFLKSYLQNILVAPKVKAEFHARFAFLKELLTLAKRKMKEFREKEAKEGAAKCVLF